MSVSKLAQRFLRKARRPGFRQDLTRTMENDLPLEVRDAEFQKVVSAFAHGLGGTTRDGEVIIPYAPFKFEVLYSKWPEFDGPRVMFAIIPKKQGNRSKLYRAFQGPIRGSRRLFAQYAAWLNVVKVAILKRNGVDTSEMETRLRNVRLAAVEPHQQALKWLEARAKKGKGAFAPHVVASAFEMLGPQWGLEEVVTYTSKVSDWKGTENLFGGFFKDRDERYFSNYKGWTFTSRKSPARKGDEIEQILHAHAKVFSGKAPTGEAKRGQLYMPKPKIKTEMGRVSWYIPKLFCGTKGWRIQTPSGSFEVGLPVRSNLQPEEKGPAYKIPSVWTQLYKRGLQEAAKKALEGSDLVQEARKRVEQSQPKRQYDKALEKLLTKLTDRKREEAALFWENQMMEGAERYQKELQKALDAGKPLGPQPYMVGLGDLQVSRLLRKWKDITVEKDGQTLGSFAPYDGFEDDVRKSAALFAEQAQKAYITKNTFKLSAITMAKGNLKGQKVTKINSGATDFGGEMVFTFEDGSEFTVRNKTIWKISKNGVQFPQFPTTFHKVKLPDGSSMKGPSEKKMVEVFPKM